MSRKIRASLWLLLAAGLFGGGAQAAPASPAESSAAVPPAGWRLVWADEFSHDGRPDPARWSYDVGGGGWGNHELEFYTDDRPENARVENGHLVIEARKESWHGKNYTSARLVTKGKGDWTYGRFEIRARLPEGRGTWPAIWLLPTHWDLGDGGWPDNGEIDLMEHVGYAPGVVHGSTHSHDHYWRKNTQRTATTEVPDFASAFHVYAMEWDAGQIRMFVDDRLYFTSPNDGTGWKSWPFYRDFHLILNLAIGGDWGGEKGVDDSIFPQRMEVDYVRVYQREAAVAAGARKE